MGLDMYLYKRIYVKNWSHTEPNKAYEITVKKGGEPCNNINTNKLVYLYEDVAYWRKANQIHKWFVDNVQNGEDDCKDYYLTNKDLRQLVDTCIKVRDSLINSGYHNEPEEVMVVNNGKVSNVMQDVKFYSNTDLASELLPTTDGFFFGNTQYNEYYLQDIEDTISLLSPHLDDNESDFIYHSSW